MAATIDTIVAALNALLLEVRSLFKPRRILLVDSAPVTTVVGKIGVFTGLGIPNVKLSSLEIKLRTLGATSTYAALGSKSTQEWRLTMPNDYYKFEIPQRGYINSEDVFVASDAATAIIEIIATSAE